MVFMKLLHRSWWFINWSALWIQWEISTVVRDGKLRMFLNVWYHDHPLTYTHVQASLRKRRVWNSDLMYPCFTSKEFKVQASEESNEQWIGSLTWQLAYLEDEIHLSIAGNLTAIFFWIHIRIDSHSPRGVLNKVSRVKLPPRVLGTLRLNEL